MANRQLILQKYAAGMQIFLMYKDLFPDKRDSIDMVIKQFEPYIIMKTPTPDNYGFYESFIIKNAPSENAFVAVQRMTDVYISKKQWDSAVAVYKHFKPFFKGMEGRFDTIISILKAPETGVRVNNLGNKINSRLDEWDPNPTPDGRFMFFSSRDRQGGFGKADVYISRCQNGEWQAPVNAGRSINGPNDETVDNVTADGNGLFLSGDFPGTYGNFDIYYINATKEGWGTLVHYPPPINSRYFDEGANMTADGKAMLFTSDRPGCVGGYIPYGIPYHGLEMGNMDIFVCLKTDSGWSQPINLGPTVNTPYAERSPYLHPDGRTLYFSSNGHPGIGRLDVFKTVRLREDSWTEWSEPVNLGKEINSEKDDWGYKVTLSGDSAFFAGNNRADGYGGWDLYSVSLPKEVRPEKVVTIKGKVLNSDGLPLDAAIKWENLTTGENAGILSSSPSDGSYIIILQPGKHYGYYAEKQGYYPASSNIDLRNTSGDTTITENIILYSAVEIKGKQLNIRINNIFFDFDDFALKPESFPELDRLYEFLTSNPDAHVFIEGHTDNVGTEKYNQELSSHRAESVLKYLVTKGVKSNRVKAYGFGAKHPISDNETDEGRAKNRRVEFRLEE
jgi:outer membrane protein OmpA-like peptidoglycan-associated protein